MTPAELRSYREGLGLTAQALADLMGCGERFVYRCEAGDKRVPPGMAAEIRALDATVECIVAHGIAQWREAPAGTAVHLLRYRSDDDLAARDPATAREIGATVHGAAVRRLAEAVRLAGGDARLVWFDSAGYDAWRGSRRDTAALRAAWAAEQIGEG